MPTLHVIGPQRWILQSRFASEGENSDSFCSNVVAPRSMFSGCSSYKKCRVATECAHTCSAVAVAKVVGQLELPVNLVVVLVHSAVFQRCSATSSR